MWLSQWSIPVPACLAPCIIPHVEEGEASEGVGDKVTHGDQITVNCSDNYEVSSQHTSCHTSHSTLPAGEQGGGADRVPERDLVADPAVRGGPLQDHAHPATQRHDRGTQPQPRRHRPLHLQGGS